IESAILANEVHRIAAEPTGSLSAHELWLRGREVVRRAGAEDLDELEFLCEGALAQEPRHAGALGLLACALSLRAAFAVDELDAPARERIGETIKQAMSLGGDDAEVLTWVAEAHLLAENDPVSARALADRALAMNPALGVAWDIAANTRLRTGEYAEALSLYERCLALNPKSPWRTYVYGSMGGCLAALDRFDEALPLLKECLQIAPANSWAAATLAAVEVAVGQIDEARATLGRLDRRQFGILKKGALGPRLMTMVEDALTAAGWSLPP
ncbi:MAG: tetratricopeptide repeat protein, partial [Caulobacteraceae bacterium]